MKEGRREGEREGGRDRGRERWGERKMGEERRQHLLEGTYLPIYIFSALV